MSAESDLLNGKENRISDRSRLLLVVVSAIVFIILGFVLLRSTGHDNSYISYWPAHMLAHHGRITNYNGEAVEQSSSLLWVLILGAVAFITRLPIPLLGPLLSIVGGVFAIAMASRLAKRINPRAQPYTVLFIATATFLLYWSFSGMEASFVAFCTVWLAVAYSDYMADQRPSKREVVAASICCVLVRPEMGAVLCVLLAGLVGVLYIRRRSGLLPGDQFKLYASRLGFLAVVVVGLVIGTAAVKIGLFHSAVPEPALAKGALHYHIRDGLQYFVSAFTPFSMLVGCLSIVGIVWTLKEGITAKEWSAPRVVCSLLVVAYSCFILWVGGDWMREGQFLVHVLPAALVLAADALSRITPPRLLPAAGLIIISIQLCGFVRDAADKGVGTSPVSSPLGGDPLLLSGLSWFERNDRLIIRDAPVAQAMDRVVARMVSVGHPITHIESGQMGFVLFKLAMNRYGQIDVTDRHGLADRRLVGCYVAAGQRRTTTGLAVSNDWFLSHQKELQDNCRIPSPDVIYDIGDAKGAGVEQRMTHERTSRMEKLGYGLVYHQICTVPRNHDWLPGGKVQLEEYIAIREDLIPVLRLRKLSVDQLSDATL